MTQMDTELIHTDSHQNNQCKSVKSVACRNCGQELPEEQFEMCKTGTRRKVCRHCHYELHTKRAWKKWWRRQLARVVIGEMEK